MHKLAISQFFAKRHPCKMGCPNRCGKRPTCRQSNKCLTPGQVTGCLVLQVVGFAVPASSPMPRCALAAPFHHCLCPAPVSIFNLRINTVNNHEEEQLSNFTVKYKNRCGAIGCVFSVALSLGRSGPLSETGPRWLLAITMPCPARTFLPAPTLRY